MLLPRNDQQKATGEKVPPPPLTFSFVWFTTLGDILSADALDNIIAKTMNPSNGAIVCTRSGFIQLINLLYFFYLPQRKTTKTIECKKRARVLLLTSAAEAAAKTAKKSPGRIYRNGCKVPFQRPAML